MVNLVELAKAVLQRGTGAGTSPGRQAGHGRDSEGPVFGRRGTAESRASTEVLPSCPTVPNARVGQVGQAPERYAKSGTPPGTSLGQSAASDCVEHAGAIGWALDTRSSGLLIDCRDGPDDPSLLDDLHAWLLAEEPMNDPAEVCLRGELAEIEESGR